METTIQLGAAPAVLLSCATQGRRQNFLEIALTLRSVLADPLKEFLHYGKNFINYLYISIDNVGIYLEISKLFEI